MNEPQRTELSESSMPSMTLLDMPDEMLTLITAHLDPRDFLRFSSSCKVLLHLADDFGLFDFS
jgi:hypothetical protein